MTSAQLHGLGNRSTDLHWEHIGGGIADEPIILDGRQGDLEHAGGNLDVAIHDAGYLAPPITVAPRGRAIGGCRSIAKATRFSPTAKPSKFLDAHQQPIKLRRLPGGCTASLWKGANVNPPMSRYQGIMLQRL